MLPSACLNPPQGLARRAACWAARMGCSHVTHTVACRVRLVGPPGNSTVCAGPPWLPRVLGRRHPRHAGAVCAGPRRAGGAYSRPDAPLPVLGTNLRQLSCDGAPCARVWPEHSPHTRSNATSRHCPSFSPSYAARCQLQDTPFDQRSDTPHRRLEALNLHARHSAMQLSHCEPPGGWCIGFRQGSERIRSGLAARALLQAQIAAADSATPARESRR